MKKTFLILLVLIFSVSAIGYADDLDQRIDSLLKVLIEDNTLVQKDAFLELKKIGRPALPKMVELMRDETKPAMTRGYALVVIASIGTDEVVPYLEEAAQDDDFGTRCEAIKYLGKIGSARAVEILISICKDPAKMLSLDSYYSSRALEKVTNKEAIPVLLEALQDKDVLVDEGGNKYSIDDIAAEALGSIGDPSVIPHLKAALKDDPRLGGSIAVALGKIGNETAIKILKRISKDDKATPGARNEAKRILKNLKTSEALTLPSINRK